MTETQNRDAETCTDSDKKFNRHHSLPPNQNTSSVAHLATEGTVVALEFVAATRVTQAVVAQPRTVWK